MDVRTCTARPAYDGSSASRRSAAADSRGNLTPFWKYVMFGAVLRPAFKDHIKQEEVVRAGGLDWTIVRPGAFVDGPAGGAYRRGFDGQDRTTQLKISRADVAAYLLAQVTEDAYLREPCPCRTDGGRSGRTTDVRLQAGRARVRVPAGTCSPHAYPLPAASREVTPECAGTPPGSGPGVQQPEAVGARCVRWHQS